MELCVTRLRYAQIHGFFSRASGVNQVSLIASIRFSLTGHHSCRAALRGVSLSQFARAIILRYVTHYKGRTRRSHRGLWSALAQSDQARSPDFIALVGKGLQGRCCMDRQLVGLGRLG